MAPISSALAAVAVFGSVLGQTPPPGPQPGTYAWPVRGPVLRSFEPPPSPYQAGHRGIDIGAPFGTEMVAAQDGVVAFAGWVAGSMFISIDHPDGVRTTYSWLSGILVEEGRAVARGQLIGLTGEGHPGSLRPHLHFGARIGETYLDPMVLLERGSVAGLVHLAPLPQGGSEDGGAVGGSEARWRPATWGPLGRGPPVSEPVSEAISGTVAERTASGRRGGRLLR